MLVVTINLPARSRDDDDRDRKEREGGIKGPKLAGPQINDEQQKTNEGVESKREGPKE